MKATDRYGSRAWRDKMEHISAEDRPTACMGSVPRRTGAVMTARTFLARLAGLAFGALFLIAIWQLKAQPARCAEVQRVECAEQAVP